MNEIFITKNNYMICEKYDALTSKEKVEFIGQVVHAVMNDNGLFEWGEKIITLGKISGLFDNVTINPDTSINEIRTGK